MKNYDPVNLILMGNTLKFKKKEHISRIYDLKGSRVARNVNTTNAKATTTLKDLNFFSYQNWEQEINLSKYDCATIKDQLVADSLMLSQLNIMDYSLLIGIEKRPPGHPQTPATGFNRQQSAALGAKSVLIDNSSNMRHRFNSPDNMWTYHISVIDYLQQWNMNKKSERFLKTTFLGAKGEELSASEPIFYQARFTKVINNRIMTVCESEKKLPVKYIEGSTMNFETEIEAKEKAGRQLD